MKKDSKPKKPMTPEMMQMANDKVFELLSQQKFNSLEEINDFLNKNINGKNFNTMFFKDSKNKTNSEKSTDLVYQAYKSTPQKGLQLVNKALELDPENIMAINFIADSEEDTNKAKMLYEKAMKIGEKKLGKEYFTKHKGQFWGLYETRPYITAKLKYADCLHALGDIDNAIKEYSEVLELNTNDNQGVRYLLASLLLNEGKYNEYLTLYKKFKEDSTFWKFNYALYLFITQGDTAASNNALKAADKCNKHVIQFLTQKKKLKGSTPEFYGIGDENEAIFYLMENFSIWAKHSESLLWVLNYLQSNKRK